MNYGIVHSGHAARVDGLAAQKSATIHIIWLIYHNLHISLIVLFAHRLVRTF